jgi:hypothetical protein
MKSEYLKVNLDKINSQQKQWHNEFIKRENNWFWKKGIWFFIAGFVVSGIVIKISQC